MTEQPEPDSPVEHYLDAMFDELAGTGGAGRRALMEAEDHLREATAGELARGLPRQEAEKSAVARFGTTGAISRSLRVVHGGPWLPVRRVFAGTWLLGSLAVLVAGLAELVAAGDRAVLLRMRPQQHGLVCGIDPHGCTSIPAAMHTQLRNGLILLVIAELSMAAFRYAHPRRDAQRMLPRFFPAVASSAFGGVTLVLMLRATDSLWYARYLRIEDGPGFRLSFVGACLSGLTALAIAVWGARRTVSARNRVSGRAMDAAPQ